MKKIIAFLLVLCTVIPATKGVVVTGKYPKDTNAIITLTDASGATTAALVDDKGNYQVTVDAEVPDIVMLFVTYQMPDGTKQQAYSPVFVSPVKKKLTIDVIAEGGGMKFDTRDADTGAFLAYSDFLREIMRSNEKLMTENSDIFTGEAKKLVTPKVHKLTADYLLLWAYSSKLTAERIRSHFNRNKEDRNKIHFDIEEIATNSATKYFPEFVNALVYSAGGKSEPLTRRMASLRNSIKDPELLVMTERNLINRYITENKGNGDFSGTLASIDSVVNDKEEYAIWVNRVNAIRRQMENLETVPDDILIDAAGNEVRLGDFKGKYLYIDFWASWCVHCVKEIPALKELEKKYVDKDILFLSISLDDNPDDWKQALEKYELDVNQFIVNSPALAKNLELSTIPRYMLYDKEGKLLDSNAPRPGDKERINFLLDSLM